MRRLLLSVGLTLFIATCAASEVSITRSGSGWELDNGHISLKLVRSADTVQLSSLRCKDGVEWAVAGSPLLAVPDEQAVKYQFVDDSIADVEKHGKQLTLHFKSE